MHKHFAGLEISLWHSSRAFWLDFPLICIARLLYGWVVKVGMNDGENIHELAFKQLPIFWLSAALLAPAPSAVVVYTSQYALIENRLGVQEVVPTLLLVQSCI